MNLPVKSLLIIGILSFGSYGTYKTLASSEIESKSKADGTASSDEIPGAVASIPSGDNADQHSEETSEPNAEVHEQTQIQSDDISLSTPKSESESDENSKNAIANTSGNIEEGGDNKSPDTLPLEPQPSQTEVVDSPDVSESNQGNVANTDGDLAC